MLIYLDIETIPSQRADVIERGPELVKVPASYKNEEKIEAYRAEHADEAYRRTALDGGYGEIVCICWAVDDGPVEESTRASADESEADLLARFFAAAKAAADASPASLPAFVGHNIAFDLRFLHHRSVVLGVHHPIHLPYNAASWQGRYVDTMFEWSGARGSIKLVDLCDVLGIEVDDEIDGSQVWDRYQAGDIDTIVKHCRADVERVRQVYRRLQYLD